MASQGSRLKSNRPRELAKDTALAAKQADDWRLALQHFQSQAHRNPTSGRHQFDAAIALLRLGEEAEAAACFKRALRLGLKDPKLLLLLFTALWNLDLRKDAVTALVRAVRAVPDDPDLRLKLAAAYSETQRFSHAVTHCRTAVELRPGDARCHAALAYALMRSGRIDAAVQACLQTLNIDPEASNTWSNLGELLAEAGQSEEALHCLRRAASSSPHPEIHSNLLLSLHYPDPVIVGRLFDSLAPAEAIAAEHRWWALRHYGRIVPRRVEVERRAPKRRLRIGYVSADFRDHSVALLMRGILAAHRRSTFTVVCFTATDASDSVTQNIREDADEWYSIWDLDDDAACDLIQRVRIDVLVDLSGHTAGNRLGVFARKPAPVQVTYCGYPDTTGLSTIDYRITDAWCDPPGTTEQLHSEKLVRLESGFVSYQPPVYSPAVSPPPARKNGFVTFASLAGRHKITPEILDDWAVILRRMPDSRLILKCGGSQRIRRALYERFSQGGVTPGRIRILGQTPRPEHMKLYAEIDIVLDTFPYAGTVGTCEALWMGVPVVTMGGETHASRVGVSLLTRTGLTDWIASTREEYAGLAVKFGQEPRMLAKVRSTLRARMAATVANPEPVVRCLERAYRRIWRASLT